MTEESIVKDPSLCCLGLLALTKSVVFVRMGSLVPAKIRSG